MRKPTPGRASRPAHRRASPDEMEERACFLIDYARRHGPVTVRQLYYRAEVEQVPGIDKSEQAYERVQRQVLALRRGSRIDYRDIADATRWMRKPTSYDNIDDAVADLSLSDRRSLWRNTDVVAEVWVEKDALAGVIYPVTSRFEVPLMVARGFTSESFAFEAVEARGGDDRPYVVYYLGDFDRSGVDAGPSLEEKLRRFAAEKGIEVRFEMLAVTFDQIEQWNLPTREPKRKTIADQNWPHDFACELDAIEPDRLRDLVQDAILQHLPEGGEHPQGGGTRAAAPRGALIDSISPGCASAFPRSPRRCLPRSHRAGRSDPREDAGVGHGPRSVRRRPNRGRTRAVDQPNSAQVKRGRRLRIKVIGTPLRLAASLIAKSAVSTICRLSGEHLLA